MSNLEQKPVGIKELLQRDHVKHRFHDMLGKKAESFLVSVMTSVQGNQALMKADPNSIMLAAATAAAMDLPINPNLGFAYIVPYNGKAQFQMGYKGFIQLAQRSGQFKTISATPVYEGQLINEDPLAGFEFDWSVKSEKVVGYAAYFKLLNGFEKTFYMTKEEVSGHGKKYSRSFDNGLWKSDFDAMAIKTLLKLLLSKYAPLSLDMQKAIESDQAVIKENGYEYPDNGSYVDYDEVSDEKQNQRILDHINNSKSKEELEQVKSGLKTEELKKEYQEKLKTLKS